MTSGSKPGSETKPHLNWAELSMRLREFWARRQAGSSEKKFLRSGWNEHVVGWEKIHGNRELFVNSKSMRKSPASARIRLRLRSDELIQRPKKSFTHTHTRALNLWLQSDFRAPDEGFADPKLPRTNPHQLISKKSSLFFGYFFPSE